jgi:hypothetical protein
MQAAHEAPKFGRAERPGRLFGVRSCRERLFDREQARLLLEGENLLKAVPAVPVPFTPNRLEARVPVLQSEGRGGDAQKTRGLADGDESVRVHGFSARFCKVRTLDKIPAEFPEVNLRCGLRARLGRIVRAIVRASGARRSKLADGAEALR